jgi:hypothetical protein
MQEGGDPRLVSIEHMLYDLSSRLQRSEENSQFMHIKQAAMMETVGRLLRFNHELSRAVLSLAPSPDNPIHRDSKWRSSTPPSSLSSLSPWGLQSV